MKVVCVSGGFDPFHEGHLSYIMRTGLLGEFLIVLVSSDNDMVAKKGKCNLPIWFRIKTVEFWLEECGIKGIVLPTMDKDGTQVKTLKLIKPDIYAEGGDVTPENVNKEEEKVCKEIGCKIVYGVGKKINSSSSMVFSNAK